MKINCENYDKCYGCPNLKEIKIGNDNYSVCKHDLDNDEPIYDLDEPKPGDVIFSIDNF